ncbi:hypothetical protein ACXYTP_25405, partial [Tsukamurella ocularis]
MTNLSGETTPRVTITHHYDDVLQQILAEVKGLREDLQPKPIVVRNAMNIPEGVSPQAVIQRVEERHRRVNVRSETAEAAFLRAQHRGPHRKVLDEYMRVFDAEPRDYAPALELPLDEHARRAFGIGRHDYNRYAAGLADALDIP